MAPPSVKAIDPAVPRQVMLELMTEMASLK
jgi:hypothetical protein